MFKLGKKKNHFTNQGIKTSKFDFERISLYFKNSKHDNARQVIDQNTADDLDLEELFMYVDRTHSKIGQQYLYSALRTIPEANTRNFELEIEHFEKNLSLKESTINELKKLNTRGAYFIQKLIFDEQLPNPKWFWILPVLSNLSIAAAISSVFLPQVILFALPVLVINTFIHFWNKTNLFAYSNAIPQLLLLQSTTRKLLKSGSIQRNQQQVSASELKIRKIGRMAFFFKLESKMTDEISQAFSYLIDLINGIFLLETLMFFRFLRKVEVAKDDIDVLFKSIGFIDAALSISALRSSVYNWSKPEFLDNEKKLEISGLYHPLLVNPVPNDLNIHNKSVLISGSNMSGKTTFIRTIGINILLAQSINTVFGKKLKCPPLDIYSAIRISDDLLEDTSYYFAEVKRIKELLDASEESQACLFLLDELFKGTNTIERIASGKAVLSSLNQKNHIVFASTHDLELTEFLSNEYNYFHFEEHIEMDKLIFDYKLKPGQLTNTNAIKILEINNFPQNLTNEAKSIAEEFLKKKRD